MSATDAEVAEQIGPFAQKIVENIGHLPKTTTPEQRERREKQRQEAERLRCESLWGEVSRCVGSRYESCRIENFEYHGQDDEKSRQQAVVFRLEKYLREMDSGEKRNVIFYGPCGTGKDHLITGMLHEATTVHGLSATWVNGLDLFGKVRDSMDTDVLEEHILSPLLDVDILAISDPVPPFSGLTNFQASFLYRLVERRYRRQKPTWLTANFESLGDAEESCGVAIIDRLKDGALVLECNWPSYRKPAK